MGWVEVRLTNYLVTSFGRGGAIHAACVGQV